MFRVNANLIFNTGRAYLSTFMQGREIRGTTIIHQCHVCNRKFKKKTDRDRHLFVHDIKDMSIVQHCELCNYSASRLKYLEKHFQKHRCIYRYTLKYFPSKDNIIYNSCTAELCEKNRHFFLVLTCKVSLL